MSTRKLEVNIVGDADSLSRAFGKVGKDTSKLEQSLHRAARGAALAGLAIAGAFAVTGTKEIIEQEKASARTANVLETMGHKANVTQAQVEGLASALQEQTGTQDDAIQSAENLLLTFGKIRNEAGKGNDMFTRATKAANDLSVAFEKDLNASAIMVGKALNDPIKGVTALSRVGVSFTAQQKEQIKTLVESGRTLDAQKLIIGALERQVGGAAASEGRLTEASQQAQRQFEDLSESVVSNVLPPLVAFGTWASENTGTVKALAAGVVVAGAALITYSAAAKTAAVSTALLSGALNPVALGLAAVAAIGLGAAFLILNGRTNNSADALRVMTDATNRAADAHRNAAEAARAQNDALLALKGAVLTQEESSLRLKEAHQRVAEALDQYGPKSLEYRRALLDERRAELDVARAKGDRVKAGEAAVKATQKSNKAVRDEIAAAEAAVKATSKNTLAARLGVIQGKDAEKAQKARAAAEKRLSDALSTSTARHQANAKRAQEAADAMGGATPKAAALKRQLELLAKAELSRALESAIRGIGAAADIASGAVSHLYDLVRNAPSNSFSRATGRGGPAPSGTQSADEARGGLPSNPSFALARVPIGSPTDLARASSRGDRAANTARSRAERTSRAGGANEEDIRQAGERAYIAARKGTLTSLLNRINARRKKLIRDLKKYDINARRKVKVPGPKYPEKRQKAIERRASMKQSEQGIREELETLANDYADAYAELAGIGEQIAALDRTDEAEAKEAAEQAAADAKQGVADTLDAAVAEAALTKGTADDVAAAKAVEAQAQADLDAARASGKPADIAAAARALLSARQARENAEELAKNTDALNANTDALSQFGGSAVFSYRGQDYGLRSIAPPSSDRLVGTEVLL